MARAISAPDQMHERNAVTWLQRPALLSRMRSAALIKRAIFEAATCRHAPVGAANWKSPFHRALPDTSARA